MCGLLSVVACSLDTRTLTLSSADEQDQAGRTGNDAASGAPSVSGSGSVGDAGDGSEPIPDETPSCVGASPERRCTVTGGSFQLDPQDAAVPSRVASFELDELEVTVARFRKFAKDFSGAPDADAGAHPAIAHSGWRSEWNAYLPQSKAALSSSLHCNAEWETWTDDPGEREDYPLTCASYYVAFAFCAANGGRLPTEAEWEYAASGGTQQRGFPWGNAPPSFELAVFGTSAIASAGERPQGVARFGQLDLAGSAWEWTLDLYRQYPARCEPCAEVENGLERVLRGGAFVSDAESLASTYRFHLDPQLALGDVGFRCAYAL